MKKLMIAAAIVCAAVCSFGAAGDWSCGNNFYYNDGEGGELAGSTIYVFDGHDTTSAAVLSALASTGLSALDDALGSGTVNASDIYSFSGNGLTQTTVGSDNYYSAFLIAIANNGGTDFATAYDIGDIKVTSAMLSGQVELGRDWGVDDMPGKGVAGWTEVYSVPEPTSGLLLLIGMAGLALRRRRA